MPNELARTERRRLAQLEIIIDAGAKTFFDVGAALAEIRESRLYRASNDTFEEYCRERWEFGRSYVNKLVFASETKRILGTTVPIPPTNECQIRPLSKLPAEQRPEAWRIAVDRAPEVDGVKRVTGAIVGVVVREMTRDSAQEQHKPEDPAPIPMPMNEAIGSLSKLVREILSRTDQEFHEIIAAKLRSLAEEIEEGIEHDPGRSRESGTGSSRSADTAA